MGNNHTLTEIKLYHPKFETVIIKEKLNLENEMIVTVKIPNLNIFQDCHIKTDFLLLPTKYQINVLSKFCISTNQVRLTYAYYEHTLKLEIQNRKLNQYHFSQEQLWYLLYNMLQIITKYQINQIEFGDINPSNILMNRLGKFKIISRLSYPGELSALQKVRSRCENYRQCFLAPQEMIELKKGEKNTKYKQKVNAFSLGLTILQCASLQVSSNLYIYEFRKFNEIILQKRIKNLVRTYNNLIFLNILKNLVKLDQISRNSCQQIYQYLKPYSKQINQLQQFYPPRYSIIKPEKNFRIDKCQRRFI